MASPLYATIVSKSTLHVDAEVLITKAFERSVEEGMSLLFQRYYQPLCAHAVRFVYSQAIAEDLVSDIFYEFQAKRLYENITSSYRAFLYTSVRNRCFDYVRREIKPHFSLEDFPSLAIQVTQQPDTITQFEELYHDVEKAIHALPLKRRQIYLLHRFEGKPYKAIADELQISPKTVEIQMSKAIQQVKDFLRDKWLLFLVAQFLVF
ncbi:RNA polymerase sigma-70 factor [Siphonobacter sp. SORGH_AS_0500]|uniref:RNA polymerase sigma-70 factor n=1 Tax=Siphonobacter sp. SORGH_AS_0500 TaxID=1864824 RepID=UPI002854A6E1|nr:RNA polymerase sigma-70 factor [Siphonobacter sp. SORGH_AS_0500]MDR6195305.1 RNA polymerase sigma-70 factor (family 1) [Siphonobacter sp. SORGH_AS_0500]